MVDVQSLLQPVSEGAPAGSNLEYSAEYTDFERSLQGKPERQVGDVVVPAEPPDWSSVIERASALLRSSKDLRVATELARALLKKEGFAGFAQGLAVVRGLVETYWPVLYPRLDEGDSDPTSRVNVMATLTHRDMLQAVRAAPLVRSKAVGVVTLRDVDAANARPRDGSPGSPPSWDAMFQAIALAELADAARSIEACEREARELELAWRMHVDAGGHASLPQAGGKSVDDFADLRQLLAQGTRFMKGRLEARQGEVARTEEGATNGVATPPGAEGRAAFGGELRSREDVVRAIDGICAYYARNEPSSPVPLLLERCKRLVSMSFLDIVRDMMPDGVSTIETIAGKRNE